MTRNQRAWSRSHLVTLVTLAAFAITIALVAALSSSSSSSAATSPAKSATAHGTALPSGLPRGGLSPEALATVRKYPKALTVARFYRGIETGKISDEQDVLAADWRDVPLLTGQGPGRAGFASVLRTYHKAFPNLRVHIAEITVAGDVVTSRNILTGTQEGTFLGVPATHRVITFRTTDVHHLAHGRIQISYHLEGLYMAYLEMTAKH